MHTSTRKSPFEIVEGWSKVPPILRMDQKIFTAVEYVCDLQTSFQKIKDTIQALQQKQKRVPDKHGCFLEFKEDEWVLLKFSKSHLKHTMGIGKECMQVIKSTMISLHAVTMDLSKFTNTLMNRLIG